MQKSKWISDVTRSILIFLVASITGQSLFAQWNNPHVEHPHHTTLHGAFASSPKTLDPARAYSSDELGIISQIYEPPLQYHFLKRPFTLIPLTATSMPMMTYYDQRNHILPDNTSPKKIVYTIYDINIQPGIYYQPHPAFAKNATGQFLYHHLTSDDIKQIRTLHDFKKTGTRELIADDYMYEIKRLASPQVQSPIFGLMSEHIIGFHEFLKSLQNVPAKTFIDLRSYPLAGVTKINRYEYQIKIKGVYPQFVYWLAMPFFAPIPWEADAFYSQPDLIEKNMTLDWYPIGTGPYYLSENNPNQKMVLIKNPYFHGESFPTNGELTDAENNYLKNAGASIPFVEKMILSLDKENIPRWNKFLQGYYDQSGIHADSFDQAIKLDQNGKPLLTEPIQAKGIQLQTTVNPSVFYIGFNMLDDVIGGLHSKNKKLRQAIAIALDYEEYIQLFMNGRGMAAHGPIPPGIFGYTSDKTGINTIVYVWENGKAKRKPLDIAKKLLAEAGYPNGMNPKTGKPLVLHYDVTSSGNPDDKTRFDWMRKQFAKLGIQLNIRHTEYNRFQDKVRTGQVQLFSWGWLADYPDPENFLFLMTTQNGKVKFLGENAANYSNPKVDALFEEIKNMKNGPERQKKINALLSIIREDSPWIWGVHPIDFTLTHTWMDPMKPHAIANNTLKYQKIDAAKRAQLREKWNQPILWPLWILLSLLIVIGAPLGIVYYRREHRCTILKKDFK